MSTRSSIRFAAIAILAILAGCILPGPWDYTPKNEPVFRGIWMSAYAVADRPVQNVCFERFLNLDEGHTDAFAFYDSASVGIEGTFSTGGTTLILQPLYNTPNCFSGNPGVRFVRGSVYTLTARIVWDSAGKEVTTILRSTARIPQSFRVSDTARAPKIAQIGVAYVKNLDTNVEHLKNDLFTYHKNDSVFYIGGTSSMNNLSHFFGSVRSEDVNGVLITQRYDTLAGRPATSFDSILGIKPDTSQFYYPGDHRRLILYPKTISQNGYQSLDSMGVVNAWYWSGRNRLYFYGVEKAYTDYAFSNINEPGGGPVDENPKIQTLTNVTGGRGFFAGMIVDSFDVFVKTDPLTQVYPYAATRAYTCRDNGWFESRDCAGWYHEFCSDNGWKREDCQLDAIYTWGPVCDNPSTRSSAPPGLCDSVKSYQKDTLLGVEALTRYCIDHNYPADFPGCTDIKQECEQGKPGNGCQLILWKSCELNYWKPAPCVEGRKSYCRENGDVQKELCRGVN
ncbi:MAG TPA: hypothetical protein DCQ83_01515 [Fibrobacteres bacterium]|jgi:hypothetical protein|nr:hypothetical protein [Fibrobacterota bacterium]